MRACASRSSARARVQLHITTQKINEMERRAQVLNSKLINAERNALFAREAKPRIPQWPFSANEDREDDERSDESFNTSLEDFNRTYT